MPSPAVLVRILGALFYYSPTRPEVRALFDCLPTLDEIYPGAIPARWLNYALTGQSRMRSSISGNFLFF